MIIITITEAKANFEKYIELASSGTPVYIGARGKREVMLHTRPKR